MKSLFDMSVMMLSFKIFFYISQAVLIEKLKYAIYFCKSIDTDEYARVAMVEPTEATVSENNSDLESEVSEEM